MSDAIARIGEAADELQTAAEIQQQAIHDIVVALNEYTAFWKKQLKEIQELAK